MHGRDRIIDPGSVQTPTLTDPREPSPRPGSRKPDAEEFAELACGLHDVPFEETVERVIELAVKALNCAYAGVMVVHAPGRVETVSATHPVVAELDALQMECRRPARSGLRGARVIR